MIPKINGNIEYMEGYFQLPERINVCCTSFANWIFNAFMQRTGRECSKNGHGEIIVKKNKELPKEAYILDITKEGITVQAADEQGAVWAFTTLYHEMDSVGQVKCCHMEDSPAYMHRGLNLDCVRHFFPVAEVKKIIEEMSLLKMNVLHWNLSNDQGFRIELETYPEIHSQCADYYTKSEIRDVIKYAQERGITVMPEINMPGHTTAVLAAHPELGCHGKKVEMGENGGIYPVVLCPGKEETYRFIENMLDEICSLFPSERIHIGGDEAPDREWKTCPCCKQKMEAEGFQETRQLQGYFSERVLKMLKKHGRDAVCWNDSLQASNFPGHDVGIDEEVPEQKAEVHNTEKQKVEIQYWSIQYADSMQKYIQKNQPFIYSDMFELYFDYPCAMLPMERVYNFEPEIRKESYKEAENLSGFEACLWTEHIADAVALEERLFPRLYALAEHAWTKERDYRDFLGRLNIYIESARNRGIHSLSAEDANPQGEKKKEGISAYREIMQKSLSAEAREVVKEHSEPNKDFQEKFMREFLGIDLSEVPATV